MELYVADAFTTTRFSGNQAGVALLGSEDFPAETLMRALAGELKHSETAFVKQAGEKAFQVLHMDVYGRADFIVDETDGRFYCLEMNGLPGMTPQSLLPLAARAAGLSYGELCEQIIEESINIRYRK